MTGTSSSFQAVPGCGMKVTVSNLSSIVNKAKQQTELSKFESLVAAGSAGLFTVNGVQIEVSHSQNMRLGQLIGMNVVQDDTGGSYDVIIGNREWMNRNGFIISAEIDRNMTIEEEQGRSAVLCAINGEWFIYSRK